MQKITKQYNTIQYDTSYSIVLQVGTTYSIDERIDRRQILTDSDSDSDSVMVMNMILEL